MPGNPPGKGLPIGNLTSQYFANLYLGELDHFIKDRLGVQYYVRYMDDLLLLAPDKSTLKGLLVSIEEFSNGQLKLNLKEKATKLAPISDGVPFLGFRLFPNLIRLQRQNLVRMRKKIRGKEKECREGMISVEEMAQSVASLLAHVSHADTVRLRQKIFEGSMQFG